jgi:class 3 adenylate cyclase
MLADDLGIAPSPLLKELERRILQQDPSLDAARAPEQPASPPAPEPAAAEAAGLGEERKVATILLARVVGAGEGGERLDPERLRTLSRAWLDAVSEVVGVWGGTVEQHAGDAAVAVFGVPTVHEDDPERAVRAALELVERVGTLDWIFRGRHGITLSVRIGIDTGDVIAAADARDGEQRVAGDAVTVAALLEQAAAPASVLVGGRTHATARRAFRFGPPVELVPPGAASAVTGHPVAGALAAAGERPPTLQAPLIGRERELSRLNGLLEETVETATPHLVLVYGPAGIGKSRLAREFVAAAAGNGGGVGVLAGRCVAAGHGITYWALGEILRQACGIALDDPADEAAARLLAGTRAGLERLGLPEPELERTVYALATTAGIASRGNPLDELEPRLVAEELSRAWPRFATALALERPTIVLIEDLHWAGAPLVEMLERLIARCEGPLLLLTTARPEFAEAAPGFAAGRERVTSISLQALTEREGAALVDGLLDAAELPQELCLDVLRTAEGNPFFLEEIVLQMIDSGTLVRQACGWRADVEGRPVAIPDTVHGVLAARIDALSPGEKRVLQEAAVVGRRFWQEPLARGLGPLPVAAALLRLEQRGFVVARPTSSFAGLAEYQFKHALVRDVAYAGLPKARRARAHAEHAEWVEELAGGRREEVAELIAAHYRTALTGEDADLGWAADPEAREAVRKRGVEALLAAGKAARHRFAIDRAVELHEQAVALADGPLERGRALAELGDDHEAAYHGDEAFEAYLPALELLRDRPEASPVRAHICLMASRMAAVKWGGFRTKPTAELMDSLVDGGLAVADDEETRAWLTVLKANIAVRRVKLRAGDPLSLADRRRLAEAGVEAAEQLDRPALLSQSYRTSGLLQSLEGDWHRTLATARRDIRLVDRLDQGEEAFALFWNALFFMEIAGEFRASVAYAERSLELSRSLTAHEQTHGTYTVMYGGFHLGRWDGLERLAVEHLAAWAKEPGVRCPYTRAGQLVAAIALAHQGRLGRAAEIAATFKADPDRPALPEALFARYLLAAGDAEAARELAETIVGRQVYAEENAVEVLVELDALTELGEWDALEAFLPQARTLTEALALVGPTGDRAEGLARAAGGDRVAAEELLRRALARYSELEVAFDAARTREHLAGVVVDRGAAAQLRAEALSTYEALGAAPHAERARALA